MKKEYDLLVVGTGPAASKVTSFCRGEGWSVAVIDSRPFGGTCPLRGCDPKKVLLTAAGHIDHHKRAYQKKIVGVENVKPNWKELVHFKRMFTEPVPRAKEKNLSESGIDTFHGRAHFADESTLSVNGEDLVGNKILIATGAKPRPLGFPGAEHVATSADFLDLDTLPPRIVFIGGGYVSFELAHAAARFGAKATIVHRNHRPLQRFEPDVVAHAVEASREAGIDVCLEADVEGVEKKSGGFEVRAKSKNGIKQFQADLVIHGAGRVPEIDDLELQRANVEREKGVVVNEFLQSVTNPAVYAAGDAAQTGGAPLTPVASYEGQIVAQNMLEPNSQATQYHVIPSVVFTVPALASVGLREEDAQQQGLDYRVNLGDMSKWFTSRHRGNPNAAYKVLVNNQDDHILGAHLLGPHAEEVINVFAVAMQSGMRASELKQMRFAYPTSTSDISSML